VRHGQALPAFRVEASRVQAPIDPSFWDRAAVAADRSTHDSDVRRLARRPRRRTWRPARRAGLGALRVAYAAWLEDLGYDPSERVARLRLERVRLYPPAALRLFESAPGSALEDGFVSAYPVHVLFLDALLRAMPRRLPRRDPAWTVRRVWEHVARGYVEADFGALCPFNTAFGPRALRLLAGRDPPLSLPVVWKMVEGLGLNRGDFNRRVATFYTGGVVEVLDGRPITRPPTEVPGDPPSRWTHLLADPTGGPI